MDVEEKFLQSEVNKNFRMPKLRNSSKDESSINSMQDVSRYDLIAQNIFKKFGSSGEDFDPSRLAEMLHEIGRIDRESLKTQINGDESNIVDALVSNLRLKYIAEISKSRREDAKLLEASETALFRTSSNQGSGETINIQNGLSEVEVRNLVLKETKRKKGEENPSLDLMVNIKNPAKKTARGDREASKARDLRINTQTGVRSSSRSNIGGSSSKGSDQEAIPRNARQAKNLGIPGYNIGQVSASPRTNHRAANNARKNRNSLIAKAKSPSTAQRILISPQRPVPSGVSTLDYKRSKMTLFTNNTLTSTLSPKSNLSQNTYKSNSRGKSKGAVLLANGKLAAIKNEGLLRTSQQSHLNVGSSQLLSKIKASGEDISKATLLSSNRLKTKASSKLTENSPLKKKERGSVISPGCSGGTISGRGASNKHTDNSNQDVSKKKKKADPDLQHQFQKGATIQNIIFNIQNPSSNKVSALSQAHLRRKIDSIK